VDTFSGVFMGLLKKVCPLCAGGEGALAPPCPSSRYAPVHEERNAEYTVTGAR